MGGVCMSGENDNGKEFKVEDRRTSRGGKNVPGEKAVDDAGTEEIPESPADKQPEDRELSPDPVGRDA